MKTAVFSPLRWAGIALALALAATGHAALTLTDLHDFDTRYPYDSHQTGDTLMQASDGNFYGTTFGDGTHPGTIFRLTSGGTFTTLHTFDADTEGRAPAAALLQATDGNLYGTTSDGGPAKGGGVFRLTPDGAFAVLHLFTLAEGGNCAAPLTQGQDGNFYGTTTTGPTDSIGTVFRLTPDGTLTTLHLFPGASFPGHGIGNGGSRAALIGTGDGSLYGTTVGSLTDYPYDVLGSVFRLAADGTFTTLHSFQNNGDGGGPIAFFRGADGNFYGATNGGGSGVGSIFQITLDGTLTTLRLFSGVDNAPPLVALIQGIDGAFYGLRADSGYPQFDGGSVFRFTPDGTLTTLRAFDLAGTYELTDLVQTADGAFYGTTASGGASGDGTIFRLGEQPDTVSPVVGAAIIGGVKIEYSESPGRVRLTLSSAPTADLTVNYTVGGDARRGVDYRGLRGSIVVRAGQTTRVIRVNALPYVSGPKKIILELRLLPGDGYTLGAAAGPFKFVLLQPQ